jgi:hypothetical protein
VVDIETSPQPKYFNILLAVLYGRLGAPNHFKQGSGSRQTNHPLRPKNVPLQLIPSLSNPKVPTEQTPACKFPNASTLNCFDIMNRISDKSY